jgi:ATP-dependent protease ClpP protease subunit
VGAIPIHHTATVEGEWDGPAAVAAMPAEYADLHYCHAWQSAEADASSHTPGDDDEDDKKSSFAMPHHKTKGGPAFMNGVRNALARLENSNIPEADKAGVKAHLQAHMDDNAKKDDGGDNQVALPLARFANYGSMTAKERIRAGMPRVQRLSSRTDWFRITDHMDGQPARVDLYDEIGFWGVNASDFNAQLNAIAADRIEVHVNSPGGDVFDGIAILNLLRAHPAPVDVVVDGLAASAASFIAMAGDTVTMMPNSQLMIHDASGLCLGNQQDMADMAKLLDLMSDNIASIYAGRTGTDAGQWRDAMRAETWYSADEAVRAGLADQVGVINGGKKPAPIPEPEPVANVWNLSFYAYAGRSEAPTPAIPTNVAPEPPGGTPALDGAHPHAHPAHGNQGDNAGHEYEHSHSNDADHRDSHNSDDSNDDADSGDDSASNHTHEDIGDALTWDPEVFRQAMERGLNS